MKQTIQTASFTQSQDMKHSHLLTPFTHQGMSIEAIKAIEVDRSQSKSIEVIGRINQSRLKSIEVIVEAIEVNQSFKKM